MPALGSEPADETVAVLGESWGFKGAFRLQKFRICEVLGLGSHASMCRIQKTCLDRLNFASRLLALLVLQIDH